MSDITCPFDGGFCQRKQDRLNDFHRVFLNNPHLNIKFRSTADMFWDCPIKHDQERKETCERYRRYLFIVEKVKQEIKEQYEQR